MGLRNFFEHPLVLVVLVVLVIALFGGKRLPEAARGLGRSMRIFKSEVKEMKNDGKDADAATASSKIADPAPLEGKVTSEHVESEHQTRAS